jgi:calcium-dependent protein kinase
MGNQQGKGISSRFLTEPAGGTRETIAAWHREGVSVWDVYESIDCLGQGHMGSVYRVRRKDRSLHNEATRQATAKRQNNMSSDDGKNKDSDRTPKIGAFARKTLKPLKTVKRVGSKGKAKAPPPEPDAEDLPLEPSLAQPSKAAAPPKSILKQSHYSNPTLNELPGDDDDDDDLDEATLQQWKEKTGGKERAEHIKGHVAEMLEKDQEGALKWSVHEQDPLSDSPKVLFKKNYACKTVLTSRVKDGRLNEMMNEIYMMRSLDHPYILNLYEIYQTKRKLWLITELCTGGDLTSRQLSEPEVAVVMEQILRALAYMHGRGIVHSDLKLENVLYEDKRLGAAIRLIDFGLSKTYDRAEISRKVIGTAYTLSPEIVGKKGKYTDKTDIWSLGVCAWVLLSGDFPFIRTEADLEDSFRRNRLLNAQYKFGITWSGRGISRHAKYFVGRCLKKNSEDRWTAKEALAFTENTWIPAMQEQYKDEDDKVVEAALNSTISAQRKKTDSMDLDLANIKRFCSYGRMKKTILMAMAQMMDRRDVGKLNELFLLADTEDTGTLNLLELKNAIQKVNPSMADKEIEAIFKGIDQDKSGEIHYAEFLAALAESQGLVTMDRLAEAFDRIDREGKGYISHDDLKMVLGKDYDHETVNRMIEEGDFKKNDKIDYEELLKLMFEDPSKAADITGDVTESLRSLEGFKDLVSKSTSR